MKRLIILAAMAAACPLLAQTPPPPALNQTWYKVAVQDQTVSSANSITYRFGAPQGAPVIAGSGATPCATVGGCWTTPITSPGGVTLLANPAPLGNPIVNTLKELDILEIATPQTVNVDGVAVTVPALTLASTTNCPVGQYWQIAGGSPGEQAAVPKGTVYRIEPSTACITAAANTIEDLTGNLFVLVTAVPQIIPVTTGVQTNFVQVLPNATPPAVPSVLSISNLSVVLNGTVMNCVTADNAPGLLTCTPAPHLIAPAPVTGN